MSDLTQRDCFTQRQTSSANTPPKALVIDTGLPRPFTEGFTVNSNVVALVVLLFTLCSPATVLGIVMPIGVDAVQTMTVTRSTSHINQEVLVGGFPPVAYANAASTVAGKISLIRVGASFFHATPSTVFGGDGVTNATLTVSGRASFSYFASQAPTRFRVTACKVLGAHHNPTSTIALAEPCGATASVGSSLDCDETSESSIWFHRMKE